MQGYKFLNKERNERIHGELMDLKISILMNMGLIERFSVISETHKKCLIADLDKVKESFDGLSFLGEDRD